MKLSIHSETKGCPSKPRSRQLFRLYAWIIVGLFAVQSTLAQDTLIPSGSDQWAYWDAGAVMDALWMESDFDDSSWKRGTAPLGYGNGNEATTVSYGLDSGNKNITAYFRHEFEISGPDRYAALNIRLQRDDGAVVYLNGVEILRDNMPPGLVSYDTRANSAVGGADEENHQDFRIESPMLQAGHNLLAVEIHQASPTSSDLRFDLELEAAWFPVTVSRMLPENGSIQPASNTDLAVSISDPLATTSASEWNVTYHAREQGPAPGPDFCLVALPDTQYYTGVKNGGTPEMFVQQIEWIRQHQASLNIAFVTQLGDCVENGDNGGDDIEWRHATNALYRLETHATPTMDFGIPYGFAPGNHDLTGASSTAPTSVFFNQYFGVHHFQGRDYYGGHHGTNNNNNFELFSASGLDFIIVHLEYDTTPEPALLDWADRLLKTHADRRAIIVSHYLMNKGDQGSFGPQGQAVYDSLKNNANLFLMLAGHVPGEGRRQDTWDGHTVHTLLADYQGRPNGGDGWLRILEFSPSNNVVRVKTYSPLLDQYERDADSEFILDYDMRRGDAFSEVGRVAGVDSEDHASLAWTNLTPGTTYEWYVEVTDGTRTQTSPIWSFTTGASDLSELALVEVMALDSIASELGPCQGRFAVRRTGCTNTALTVALNISGSAIRGIDFEDIDNTVSLAAGVCSREVVIMPHADTLAEGLELVTLQLVPHESYVMGVSTSATMLIADHESDTDGDGVADAEEVLAATDWNDPKSLLKIETVDLIDGLAELRWSSVKGITYRVCGKADLQETVWMDLSENILGQEGHTIGLVPVNPGTARMFYAIRVVTDLDPH